MYNLNGNGELEPEDVPELLQQKQNIINDICASALCRDVDEVFKLSNKNFYVMTVSAVLYLLIAYGLGFEHSTAFQIFFISSIALGVLSFLSLITCRWELINTARKVMKKATLDAAESEKKIYDLLGLGSSLGFISLVMIYITFIIEILSKSS